MSEEETKILYHFIYSSLALSGDKKIMNRKSRWRQMFVIKMSNIDIVANIYMRKVAKKSVKNTSLIYFLNECKENILMD